jgi:hypothetical protein
MRLIDSLINTVSNNNCSGYNKLNDYLQNTQYLYLFRNKTI